MCSYFPAAVMLQRVHAASFWVLKLLWIGVGEERMREAGSITDRYVHHVSHAHHMLITCHHMLSSPYRPQYLHHKRNEICFYHHLYLVDVTSSDVRECPHCLTYNVLLQVSKENFQWGQKACLHHSLRGGGRWGVERSTEVCVHFPLPLTWVWESDPATTLPRVRKAGSCRCGHNRLTGQE